MTEAIRLSVGVPTAGTFHAGFGLSLAGLIGYIAANRGFSTRPECSVEASIDLAESSVIHSNRAAIVERALAAGRTHLLFLDDDMAFEPRILDILFGRRQEVVCVNYLMKSADPQFVAVDLAGRRVPTVEGSTGLLPVAYSGFGVSLFDLKAFARTPRPWFLPEYDEAARVYTTEDNPCYKRLRAAGATVYLDQDASKLVSHVGRFGWSWRQWSPPPPKPDPTVCAQQMNGAPATPRLPVLAGA